MYIYIYVDLKRLVKIFVLIMVKIVIYSTDIGKDRCTVALKMESASDSRI